MSRQTNPSGSFDPNNKSTSVGTNTTRNQHTPPGDKGDAPYEPSNVSVDKVHIIHRGGTLDLTQNFYSLVITESLFENSITCRLEFVDTTEKMAELDPDGTETLRVTFNSEKNREKALRMGANILDFVFTKNN